MATPDDLSAALARLGALGDKSGVDIRPVLLRVVVDLFLHKGHHAPSELQLFEAMVGPLLDDADAETRRIVTEKLAIHPQTPMVLLDRLLDEQSLISADTFRLAAIGDADLLIAAETGLPEVAAMIAHRPHLPPAVVAALAARPEPRVAMALVANPAVAFERPVLAMLVAAARAHAHHGLAEALAARAVSPLDIAPLFALLSQGHRRRVVDAVRRLHLGRRQWGRPDAQAADTLNALDGLVLAGEWDDFDRSLCQALGCDERILRPLLHDGSGDVLALALAAAGATPEMAARAFILGDPTIGRSVASVRRLTSMVETIAPVVARRLIDAMVTGSPEEPRRAPALPKPAAPARRLEPAAEPAMPRRETVAPPLRKRGP